VNSVANNPLNVFTPFFFEELYKQASNVPSKLKMLLSDAKENKNNKEKKGYG